MATVSAEPRRRAPAFCVVFLLALAGCNNAALDAASREYQAERSYRSLVTLHAALELGMPRDQVEGLLGPPEYSPIDGQVYYGSDARDESRDPPATIGLVLDYRDSTGTDRGTLQSIRLGPIRE